MKYVNKIRGHLQALFFLGVSLGTIQAEVVITEFFILSEENSHVPQYIELYNTSGTLVDLNSWSIKILLGDDTELNLYTKFNNDDCLCDNIDNTIIDPYGYFLISSKSMVTPFGSYFYNDNLADINFDYLFLPYESDASDAKGTIILLDNNSTTIDSIRYDIDDESWEPLVSEGSRGQSLRLHSPYLDNSLPEH